MYTVAGRHLSQNPKSTCTIRLSLVPLLPAPSSIKVREYPKVGATNPSDKYEHIWQTTWRYTLTMRLNCLFQTAIDHTDNTIYYDVIKNRRDFHKLRPFARIFSL